MPTITYAEEGGSSPRPWRCFLVTEKSCYPVNVFSTSVEVFLFDKLTFVICFRLLHVRGGVSLAIGTLGDFLGSSPRPWRCFLGMNQSPGPGLVFSTSVEVFLTQ